MFDIGFFELLVIGIVGLFVIGPEQLPSTIKSIAIWVSRVKRNLLDTRREFEEQIGADEIRREIYNEQVLHNLEKMKDTKAELEQRINQWKDDALSADEYLDQTPDEPDIDPSHTTQTTNELEHKKPLQDADIDTETDNAASQSDIAASEANVAEGSEPAEGSKIVDNSKPSESKESTDTTKKSQPTQK